MAFATTEVLRSLPQAYAPFAGSEYPMPVSQALLDDLPDLDKLRSWLQEAEKGELADLCEPVAIAAEVIESRMSDRELYFIDDSRVRSLVFQGAKWRSGWVVVAGEGISRDLVNRLRVADYMIFSAHHDDLRHQPLPARETGAIYYLQLMVRYAMIWGQIAAGDDHEMGHFLEQDMPGAMVVRGPSGPVERLVLLSLMKMGCPAVVGPEFPYDIGPRAVAQTDDQVLSALGEFPNMRVRVIGGEQFSLPGAASSAHAREEFVPQRLLTGLFQLRQGLVEEGVIVSGQPEGDSITVIVEVADPQLDLPVSVFLEAQAASDGSYIQGARTSGVGESYRVELARPDPIDGQLLGEVIRAGLKHRYPRLGAIRVRVAFGQQALAREAIIAEETNRARDEAILAEREESVKEFHVCIDCQPFSHSHVCVVTPDRPPMCGRSRNEIKAGALWGADYRPWTRRAIAGQDLQQIVSKGETLDALAGEWSGVNSAVKRLSGGLVERVRIHAVNQAPHTSCGCFGALAFRIPGVDGIGIMDRSYKGRAPGDLTWSILANRAAGKQANGVVGVSLAYLRSPKAFAGEGGLGSVKWATKRALDAMLTSLPAGAKVATEEHATTLAELEALSNSTQNGAN